MWILALLFPILLFGQVRYEIKVNSKLIETSLKIANSFVGEVEIKPNRSPRIDKLNTTIGNPIGSPYCQAGQYFSYFEAYKLVFGKPYVNYPIPKNGLAVSTFNLAKKLGQRDKKYYVAKHDFIVWKSKTDITGHIERVIEVMEGGWCKTLGFNVSLPNGKEGVWIKKRNIKFPLNRIKNILGIVGVQNE